MTRYAVGILAFVLVGSGLAAAKVPMRAHLAAVKHGGGWLAENANAHHAWLYAAGFNDNIVGIYDLDKQGFPNIGEITLGLSGPAGLALDGAGTLYVVNYVANNVTVYPAGATQPALTLVGPLVQPTSVALDANGDVYVTSRGSNPGIAVYAQGQAQPYAYITDPLIKIPSQLLFDSQRNLFFGDNVTGVSEIPFGSKQAQSLNLTGLKETSGIALDPLNGNLFVGDLCCGEPTSKVSVYPPGATVPKHSLELSPGADYLGLAVIRRIEYVMVPNSQGTSVTFFRHDLRKASFAITTLQDVHGVVEKPKGVL